MNSGDELNDMDLVQSSEEDSDDGSYDSEQEEEGDDYIDPTEQERKKQRSDKGKFALPTKEEQMHLRETENLMRTNLLKLQVEEMLAEVKDETYAYKTGFIDWINALRDSIPLLGSSVSEEINEAWLKKHDIKGLSLDGHESSKLSMRYHPPVDTCFIGSYLHKTSTKPFLCVDIAVAMAAQCFEARDIVNFVYFDKRKLYLAVLLQQLLLSENVDKFGSDIHIACMKGDDRKPVILIKPNKKTPYLVRLYPTLPAEVDGFPLRLGQLRATKNNVRPTYWMHTLRENEKMRKAATAAVAGKKGKASKKALSDTVSQSEAYSSSHLDSAVLPPTTCYNMAILEDVAMPSIAVAINNVIAACPCIREAILLLKVWLTQRGLRDGMDSMDGHEAAVLFLYLYSNKKILSQMTPLLAFTAALKFIVETHFDKEVLSIQAKRGDISAGELFNTLSPRPAAALLMRVGEDGVCAGGSSVDDEVDGEEGVSVDYNVLWRWSESSVVQLQAAAKKSLQLIQQNVDTSDIAFMELFIRKSNFFQECDLYFHFPVLDRSVILEMVNRTKMGAAEGSLEYQQARATDDSLCNLTPWQYATRSCYAVLNQALSGRVTAGHTLSQPVRSTQAGPGSPLLPQTTISAPAYIPVWSPDKSIKPSRGKSSAQFYVTVGIVLNRETSHQRVVRGPSADDIDGCERFRSFWGSKTQLRRFHDGTIVEACVWGSDAHQSGNQVARGEIICTEIARYILQRQLTYFCAEGVRSVCTQLEAFLPAAVDADTGLLLQPLDSHGGIKVFYPGSADAATLCRRAVEALDALRSIVVSKVQGMPLPVESFRACSAALRYSAYFPAVSHPLVLSAGGEGKVALKSHSGERVTTLVHVFPVVLQMHRSGKWPASLEALRKVKTAMLIRLCDNLKTQFQIRSVVNRDHLDVLFRGFVFRMKLYTDNEVALLATSVASTLPPVSTISTTGVSVPVVPRVEVSREADALVRDLVIAPLHHSAIHATHTQNPCLGDTIRLLRRWMAGHLLSGHFDHETLELIVASVFLDAQQHSDHPQSATAGFLRSLRRIAEFDWAEKPLIIDFSDGEEMTSKDISYIRSSFGNASSGMSKQFPVHIIASYDKQRGFAPGYGQSRPEKVVLRMVTAAARTSVELLSQWMAKGDDAMDELSLHRIMTSPDPVASRFNAVIRFSRSVVSKAQTSGRSDGQNKWLSALCGPNAFHTTLFSNLSTKELSGSSLSLRDGDAPNSIQAEVVRHLSEKFGSYALFFWDDIAGDRVGVIWKPQVFLPQKFSLLESRLRLPVTDGVQGSAVAITVLNCVELMTLILAEFDGLVEKVEYL